MIKTDDLYDTYGSDMSPKAFCGEDFEAEDVQSARSMTFSFSESNLEDHTNVNISLVGDATEWLPPIMEKFQTLLRAAGFQGVELVSLGASQYGYGTKN